MDIQQSLSGSVVKSPQGHNVYVPNPLPPTIEWTNQLIKALSQADYVLGKLAREGSQLPNPARLAHPFIVREAVLSSKIEGTLTTIGEMLAFNAGASVNQNPDDLQEVHNYIKAVDFGLRRLQDLPLSLRLIKELHEQLMQGVRGMHAAPGEFRKTQNWIGAPGCTLQTAKFVPPSTEHLADCLRDLEKFLHDRQLPALIHIALCHYQFEAIHPFLDGNGRVGRLLITLLLVEKKALPLPLLCQSAFFEETRDEYYRQLFNVSSSNTWQDWLLYFLKGVTAQSKDALLRIEKMNSLLRKWKRKVASNASTVPANIVDRLTVTPYLTTKRIAEELDVAYSTAERGIRKLLGEGIISQVNDSKRDKVYCATEILFIMNGIQEPLDK